MAAPPEPPDLFIGAGGDLRREQVSISSGVPFCSKFGVHDGEIVEPGENFNASAIWTVATTRSGSHGGLPLVSTLSEPPDLLVGVSGNLRWR